jgi:hypothetical protein
MTEHVVIQRPEFTKEFDAFCRCSESASAPYGSVAVGDVLWIKWESGNFFACCKVQKFTEIAYRDIRQVQELAKGTSLERLGSWWRRQPKSGLAIVIWTSDFRRLDKPLQPGKRSFGWGWEVIKSRKDRIAWLGDATCV